ncbi:transcriptional regulator [Sphingomonas cavernae]|uniref:Transcriptional regulator n=2 Tax=Sphingomonas cavernae TaxID=2320861 RepID=A0A418W6T8_9SPHN|nr:transcriptional regulator [Sphingomonas cavernae]
MPEACGLGAALEVIGGKWKTFILWEIHFGPIRFGELKRRVTGISEKMLIQNLREMEADGIIAREMFHEIPPRVEYSVTELGRTLNDAVTPLATWGKVYSKRIMETLEGG